MANIEEIEGIGPAFGAKLVAADVKTVEALLAAGGSAAGRKALATKSGIDAAKLLEWVNRADLMRIKGVGSEFSDLLEASGVDTVKELATRNAANLFAKMVEVFFNTSHLSDIGCTYRLLSRDTAEYFAEKMTVGGSHAGPEMLMLTITSGLRFVEIPVNYLPRVGTSAVTGDRRKAWNLGIEMIAVVLRTRLRADAVRARLGKR